MNLYIILTLIIILLSITSFVIDIVKSYKYIEAQYKKYTVLAKMKMALTETFLQYLAYVPAIVMATILLLSIVFAFENLFII